MAPEVSLPPTTTARGPDTASTADQRYRAIFDSSRDAMVVMDQNGQFREVNAAALALFEAEDASRFLSLRPWDLSPPVQPNGQPSTERAAAMVEIALRQGSHAFEWRHRTLTGREFPAHVTVTRLEFAGEICVHATVRDLTETENALTALRESEQQLETIFNNSRNGIVFTDPTTGRVQKVNDTWVRETGIPRDQALGKTWGEFGFRMQPEQRQAMEAILAREGRLRDFEAPLLIRGVEHQLALSAEYIDLHQGRFLLWESRDVTDRVRAERELALLKHSVDVHYDAAYWLDTDGQIVYMNEAGARVLGYPPAELLGKSVYEINPRATRDRLSAIWATLRQQGFVSSIESVHRRKDGTEFPVELVISYVCFGGREYACAFARDIGERKQAEAERARLQEQLAHAQKMESVGRLAGGVAHDYNNMLGVILAHAEMALETVDADHPLYDVLLTIQSAAQRSADLTRQLLTFARRQTVTPKLLNLNETVAGMLNMVRRMVGEDVKLEWYPGRGLWPVFVDAVQIDQVLANLCVNARDAIAGVGTIVIETGTRVVSAAESALGKPGDYVWLAVRDDGAGMDSKTQARAFEPFFTTKALGKGTGLGLATVYGIAEQNGGFIDLQSELGRGTSIAVYFPRHIGKTVDVGRSHVPGSPRRARETVLLVEDEPYLADVVGKMLNRQGYRVLTANSPGEALRLADQHAEIIDLVITDVVMPEMNGRDLANRIVSASPRIKRLFMSGYAAELIAPQGVLDNDVAFIQKPFSASELTAKVRQVLSGA